MAIGTLLDHSVGMAIESAFATGVTPTRFNEWSPGNGLDFDPLVAEGAGIRQGSRFDRSGRRVGVIGKGSGPLMFDVLSKGFGLWWQWGFGTSISTLVSAATYQQVHTTALPGGTVMKSATIQEGIVQAGAGTIDTYTYTGATCKSLELTCSSSSPLLTAKFDTDAKALGVATAYATPAYANTGATVFNWGSLTATIGGTFTAPTTNTLASSASPTAVAIRGVTFTLDNGIDDGRWVPGSRNQPTIGERGGIIKLEVEYDAVTGTLLRDAQIAQTNIGPFIATWSGATLGVGVETLQIAVPDLRINSGAIPVPSDDKTIVTSIELKVTDGLVAPEPIWLLTRTADTAL
jgi:hypothetical protein